MGNSRTCWRGSTSTTRSTERCRCSNTTGNLSDGHTRGFAAYLAGEETLSVERDTAVREKYDFEVYRACISWCGSAGVETVADFWGRIVESDTLQEG